jgi:hypothetical protein
MFLRFGVLRSLDLVLLLNDDLDQTPIGHARGEEQVANGRRQGIRSRLGRRERIGWESIGGFDEFGWLVTLTVLYRVLLASRIGECDLMGLPIIEPIADMGNRKLVVGFEAPKLDPMTVDSNPIGAPQVANEHLAVVAGHAAMVARDPEGVKPNVTLRMTTNDNHRPIKRDVGAFIKCDQTMCHWAGS